MTVYVDDMHLLPMGQYRHMKMSHMIADTEEELHAMARAIGVKRKWYQGDHYDICKAKRTLAVEHGAVEISVRQLAAMAWCIRNGIKTSPVTAVYAMKENLSL